MEAFKLHCKEFNYKVWSNINQLDSDQKEALNNDPGRMIGRQSTVKVHLQHRHKEIYSVFSGVDEAVVDKKEKVVGRQLVRLNQGCPTHVNCSKLLSALFAIDVQNPVFPWNPILHQIVSLLPLHRGDGGIITVDFLSLKMYRCFEEVADSC